MNEQTATAMESESIVVDYELPDRPAKVWRALTDPAILGAWLMPNDIRAEVGHKFNFRVDNPQGWSGVVDCEVLEVAPEQRLAYSWRGKSTQPGGSDLDSVVAWTLTPTADGGTLLHLEHSGFEPGCMALKMMGQGWRGHVGDRLRSLLAADAA